ncbi:MAG: hypothetical protein HY519_00320 [Candidatus Aenigmarchaeota archaeon]|nr:hypothetical protein [Candidatus Aenigmarchaeota archaeon]
MERDTDRPLTSRTAAIKGLVAGMLLASGIMQDALPLKAILAAIGLLVLVDSLLPASRELYLWSALIALAAGFLAGFAAASSNLASLFQLLAAVGFALVYGLAIARKMRH